jgi:hypothetical protein
MARLPPLGVLGCEVFAAVGAEPFTGLGELGDGEAAEADIAPLKPLGPAASHGVGLPQRTHRSALSSWSPRQPSPGRKSIKYGGTISPGRVASRASMRPRASVSVSA